MSSGSISFTVTESAELLKWPQQVTVFSSLPLFFSILRECKNVELSFSDVTCKTDLLRGTKKGTVYLTPYRVQPHSHESFSNTQHLNNTAASWVESWHCFSCHTSCCDSWKHTLVSSLVVLFSCCLCPVTLRTVWVQPCSHIIWWRAAASSSQSLQPTTSKERCRLSLVVCRFLFSSVTTEDLICLI